MSIYIPVTTKRLLADTLTPVGVYLKIRNHFAMCHLLESSDYHGRDSSRSFICCQPIAGIEAVGNNLHIMHYGAESEIVTDVPKSDVESLLADFTSSYDFEAHDIPACRGKFFGHFQYDAVRYFDCISLKSEEEAQSVFFRFHAFRYVIVFDHFYHTVYLNVHGPDGDQGIAFIESILKDLNRSHYPFIVIEQERSDATDEDYIDMVQRGIGHCARGDVFQVVLSRAFEQDFIGDEFNVYRALRQVNPSPYLFYFDYGDYKLFGSSPESQITYRDGKARINPIAGTAPRTGDSIKDAKLVSELKADAKENAEHVMLVDLARNDLSKSFKEVSVPVYKDLQKFAHVIHLVSEVEGRELFTEKLTELIGESFPAGTLSGAPKFRAMQIIDQLEQSPRGFYGGSVGYIDPAGEIIQAIVIRSFLSRNQTLVYRAGAGITINSNPEKELMEVAHKLRSLRKAIEIASKILS